MTSRPAFLKQLAQTIVAISALAPHIAPAAAAPAIIFGARRNLRFGHWSSIDSPHHTFATRFARYVSEKTSGAVAVEVFPNELLGTNMELLVAQQSGTLDFTLPTSAALARIDPRFLILTLPYVFRSVRNAYAVVDGPIGQRFARDLPDHGVRVLMSSTNGMRDITNARQPINTPADLANLRIRVPPNGISFALFRLLGADPVTIPFSALYRGLLEHQVDAQENPAVNIYTSKLFEAQRYLAVTNHQFESVALTVSERTWRSFDARTQRAVAEASHEAGTLHRGEFEAADRAALTKLHTLGMAVTTPDAEPFREACRPLYHQIATALGEQLLRDVERAAQA